MHLTLGLNHRIPCSQQQIWRRGGSQEIYMCSVFNLNQNKETLLQGSGDHELVQRIATVESQSLTLGARRAKGGVTTIQGLGSPDRSCNQSDT